MASLEAKIKEAETFLQKSQNLLKQVKEILAQRKQDESVRINQNLIEFVS